LSGLVRHEVAVCQGSLNTRLTHDEAGGLRVEMGTCRSLGPTSGSSTDERCRELLIKELGSSTSSGNTANNPERRLKTSSSLVRPYSPEERRVDVSTSLEPERHDSRASVQSRRTPICRAINAHHLRQDLQALTVIHRRAQDVTFGLSDKGKYRLELSSSERSTKAIANTNWTGRLHRSG
jgi:hypothetical protein